MIHIGNLQIDIAGIFTVLSSIAACFFAFLSWLNQTKTKLCVFANRIVPNDGVYFQFDSLSTGKLSISNVGYKTTTIVDIEIGVGRKRISVKNIFHFENMAITISPGEIGYYEYPIDGFVQYVRAGNFKPNKKIRWYVRTNDNKTFKCNTSLRTSDVVYSGGSDNE